MRWLRQLGFGSLTLALVLTLACQKAPEGQTTAPAAGPDNASASASEAAAPKTVTLTIPEGTEIQVRLADSVGSAMNRRGDKFLATLDQPVVVENWVVIPRGAKVIGEVTAAQPSGHLKTPAELALTLTSIEVDGYSYELATSSYVRREKSHAKRNLAWIGGSSAGGALLGGLIGGKKGAAIGAGAGAGGGTATAYATGKKDIVLPPETRLSFRVRQPLSITRAA